MEFSTINESSLHHTLKILYASNYDGDTEVALDGHVYDIVSKDNKVIEIQTRNLSALVPKIKDAIEKGHDVLIVHPIAITTDILLYDKDNNLIKKSKSSKKGSIYDLFSELTKLYPYLLNEHFSLDVLTITKTEIRIKTDKLVQSKNGRRRFPKDWLKTDKKLNEILDTRHFIKKEDYISLLPSLLPEEFCAKDLSNTLKKEKLAPARIYNNCHIIIWVLAKMGLIIETEIKNKSHYYKIEK